MKIIRTMLFTAALASAMLANADISNGSIIYGKNSTDDGGAVNNTGNFNIGNDVIFDANHSTQYGGAIYNEGTMTIGSGLKMEGNTSDFQGGAIVNFGTMSIGSNTTFDGNSATAVGAILNGMNSATGTLGHLTIGDNVKFINNVSGGDPYSTAGAIYNQNGTVSIGSGALFQGNSADYIGGAYYQELQDNGRTANAVTTFGDNAHFIGNTAMAAGALYNYNADTSSSGVDSVINVGNNAVFQGNTATDYSAGAAANFYGTMTFGSNALFDSNAATLGRGGAVANEGIMVFNGPATFTNNIAGTTGGAISNGTSGTLDFNGDVTFSNNTASGAKNDIDNNGTVNFNAGTVTLDGGITGTGTVNFASATSLKADITTGTTLIAAGTVAGSTNLIVTGNADSGTLEITGNVSGFSFAGNNLYDITGSGTYTLSKVSTAQALTNLGVSGGNEEQTVSAALAGPSSNDLFNRAQNAISEMLQAGATAGEGIKAANALGPSAAPVTSSSALSNVTQVFGAVSSRFAGSVNAPSSGMASGDEQWGRSAVWFQGLYNASKLNGDYGFDGRSAGLALGAEKAVNEDAKLGLGFAYTYSNIKPDMKEVKAYSYTPVLYGEFRPGAWYVNSMLGYTFGLYDEYKDVAGVSVKAQYDVRTFSANAFTGYDIEADAFTITPEGGLKYANVDQHSYIDEAGNNVGYVKSDVFTGVFGFKVSKVYGALKPELRLAGTYDIHQANDNSVMQMSNGSVISIRGQNLKRWGGEADFNVTANVTDNWQVMAGYEGKFREYYLDHTGILNIKYLF